jgi:hypothetical protein
MQYTYAKTVLVTVVFIFMACRINGATPNIGARLDISELLRRCDAVTYASSSGTGSSISARSALPIPPLVIVQCMVPCESNGDGSANAAHSSGSNTSNSATTGSGMFGSLASKVAGASSGSPGWSIVIALAMTEVNTSAHTSQ